MSLLEQLLSSHQGPLEKMMSLQPFIAMAQQGAQSSQPSVFDVNDVNTDSGALLPGDPSLVTRKGVTLQGGAMRSLLDIARESSILPGARELTQIGQGYRTPEQQQAAWDAFQNGTGNLAARPGTSWHQKGLAIDAGWWSDRPQLVAALEAAGWNRFSPTGEPWHWSYGGTG